MKDWTHIQAHPPQSSGPERAGDQGFRFEPPRLPTLSLEILRVLLAGLMAVFGCSRWERQAYRERAWRVRRTVTEAARVQNRPSNNKRFMSQWSGDNREHWNKRMWTVWQFDKAGHPPRYRRIAGHIGTFVQRLVGGLLEAVRVISRIGVCRADKLITPAPP